MKIREEPMCKKHQYEVLIDPNLTLKIEGIAFSDSLLGLKLSINCGCDIAIASFRAISITTRIETK